jgi:integral membrane sensor domain MASE1
MSAVARGTGVRRHAATVGWIVAVAAVYYVAARLGLLQQLVRGQVTPLWPPTGIALAALLVRGPRIWPGIALGAFAVNIMLGPTLPAVVAIAMGNTLAPVCSYLLLRKAGFRNDLDRLRDALALVFLGALAGMLVSSTVGSGALVLSGALPAAGFWPTWSVWWTGDAMGVLVVTPMLLVLRRARWPTGVRLLRWVEAMALAACTVGAMALAVNHASMLFLVFPCLMWAAFRFQLAGAAPCALLVSTLAILAAARGSGPFAGGTLLTNMVILQAFDGAAALTALLLAALISERRLTYQEIERVCEELAEMVAQVRPGESTTYLTRRPPAREPPDERGKGDARRAGHLDDDARGANDG